MRPVITGEAETAPVISHSPCCPEQTELVTADHPRKNESDTGYAVVFLHAQMFAVPRPANALVTGLQTAVRLVTLVVL